MAGLVAGSCGGGSGHGSTTSDRGRTDPTATSSPARADRLSQSQRHRADQLVSAFENSTTTIDYAYAQNLDDGRGVTAGRAGFTTATCDAQEVVQIYDRGAGTTPLSRFVPELKRLCRDESDDTSGLPEDRYVAAWRQAAADPRFRAAQDQVVDRDYYIPAMRAADRIGLHSALARAELYDAAIQHGAGDDPDGLAALVRRTTARAGRPAETGASAWLRAFFAVRIEDLSNPHDQSTAEEWRESVDRVRCLRRIAATGNLELHGPLRFEVYGDTYRID